MTLLVKNESHLIENNLIFHKQMGVDGFIVTDNKSTDGTRQILEKYVNKGWIYEIIDEPSQDYRQSEWVDRMINVATRVYLADWVINSDADEFWHSKSHDLKKALTKTKANVIKCYWKNMVPVTEEQTFWKNRYVVKKILKETGEYDLSKWNIYDFKYHKVIHRTRGYIKIAAGNHNVEIDNKINQKSNDVSIYHYSTQNYEQFKRKVITGGEALSRNAISKQETGSHWRYFYECYKAGKLYEEYERMIGRKYHVEFIKKGILKEDKTIYDYFINQEQIN